MTSKRITGAWRSRPGTLSPQAATASMVCAVVGTMSSAVSVWTGGQAALVLTGDRRPEAVCGALPRVWVYATRAILAMDEPTLSGVGRDAVRRPGVGIVEGDVEESTNDDCDGQTAGNLRRPVCSCSGYFCGKLYETGRRGRGRVRLRRRQAGRGPLGRVR